MIQDHFGGQYANELICKGCPHYSERSEPYLAINLQVKNKKNIKDSLDALIEGEMLEGDNSYYCEKCDKKVPTLKRTCIKKLPKHLILVLKRFEFDYDTMQKMKVNDYCEFPEEINMEPYTQEGLSRREKRRAADEKGEEIDEEEYKPKYPLSLYDYKLSGVLVHSGYAEGGHYYSFIKDREDEEGKDKWYEFNDEMVKEFDKADLESECFGGEEKWSDLMGHSIYLKNSEKHRNAYVLFYERISKEDIPYESEESEGKDTQEEKIDGVMKEDNDDDYDIKMVSDKESSATEPKFMRRQTLIVSEDISQLVLEENRKYWQYRFMFSKEYSEFILELCTLWNSKHIIMFNYDTRNRDYHLFGIDESNFKEELKKGEKFFGGNHSYNKNIKFYPDKHLLKEESIDVFSKYGGEKVDAFEFEIFKLAATFYLTVTQRASLKEQVPELLDLIKSHMNKSLKACKWLITQFSNREVLLENLLQCPVGDMRKLSVGILYCAMLNLYEDEKNQLNDYWQYKEGQKDSLQKSYLGNFINILICMMPESHIYTEFNTQFFSLLSKFASLGKEARLYLLKARLIGKLMIYGNEDASVFKEFFNDNTDIIYDENDTVELGLPIRLDKLKLSLWEDLFMKKRDMQIAEASQDFTYIYETLSLLIRSCVFKAADGPTFVDDMRYTQLHENEYLTLQIDEKDMTTLIDSCSSKQSIKHLGSILLHLCANNMEFDVALRGVLTQGINDKQLDDLKSYFPIFKRYLMIQDENSEDRVMEGLREYWTILKNNNKYVPFMAKFTSFLVKMCNISRAVAEALATSPEDWDWVIEWIRANPYSSKSTQQQYKNHYREIAHSHYKINRLDEIKSCNFETYENEHDSDDDMSDHKFFKGEKIDYQFETDRWTTAEIVIVLDEMIHVQYQAFNQTKSHWFSPNGKRARLVRMVMFFSALAATSSPSTWSRKSA
jgi:hypothetical protein